MKNKTKKLKEDYEFEEIPDGFVRMKMSLTFNEGKEEDIIENQILRMLVRDYYVLYSKKRKFKDKQWIEFDFYSRPQDETMIAYRFGIYAEVMLFGNDPKAKERIELAAHGVPDGFPKCIRVKSPKDSL